MPRAVLSLVDSLPGHVRLATSTARFQITQLGVLAPPAQSLDLCLSHRVGGGLGGPGPGNKHRELRSTR